MSEDEAGAFLEKHAFEGEFITGAWMQLTIADAADDALIGDLGIHVAADRSVAEFYDDPDPSAHAFAWVVGGRVAPSFHRHLVQCDGERKPS